MNQFVSYTPTRIILGADAHKKVGEQILGYGHKVLLVYGGKSLKTNGTYQDIIESLKDNNISFVELGGVQPNPKLSLVYQGIRFCKEHKVDFILAAGGGSVIDTAKAIAAGVCYNGDVWDFYMEGKTPEQMLPVGVVLTIPAAGSEAGCASVITKEDTIEKRTMVNELAFPKFAILNPKLCFTLPKNQIAAGGADIFAHVMERYFEPVGGNEYSDRLCEATMKTILELLPQVMKNPENYDVWANLMWAGCIAHNGILGSGRKEDWASHNIEHELSAEYEIAHGAGLAIIIPAWMRYVYKEHPARFLQFAERVLDRTLVDNNFVELSIKEEEFIEQTINQLEEFFRSLGLATRLSEAGIDDGRFATMAKRATQKGSLGNFMILGTEDVERIYRLAL
jgi:alcohol dehydrogenase YqhD (iron-dependent ADH family)